jgi:hypothetical protein
MGLKKIDWRIAMARSPDPTFLRKRTRAKKKTMLKFAMTCRIAHRKENTL